MAANKLKSQKSSPTLKTRKRRKKSEPSPPPTLADLSLAIGMNMPLDTRMAALYLGLAPASLEVYRSDGIGPRCSYAATRPRYLKSDLDAWVAKGTPKQQVAS